MSLVALNDLKDYLGIALANVDHDDFLNSEISLFDNTVLNYCNRIFEQTTITEIIYHDDFSDRKQHYLYHHPVISITSITEKHPDNSDVAVTGFRFNKRVGRVEIVESSFNTRSYLFQNYSVGSSLEFVYEAGYTTVPLEIQESIKALIQARFNRKQSGVDLNLGNNVQRISIPGVMGIDFDYTLNSNERSNKYGMLLGDYLNVFDNYRSERTLIGDNSEVYLA
jgi:hypothetical protein